MAYQILQGTVQEQLKTLSDCSIQSVITSPPYWGLRDYGTAEWVGGDSACSHKPEVTHRTERQRSGLTGGLEFREVRRVLRDDGTLWLNIGDSYNSKPGQRKTTDKVGDKQLTNHGAQTAPSRSVDNLKPKDLVGIPWMLAFALRDDGWYLRQDIIWAKGNAMPESVTDRCTKSHEHMFLFSKSPRYYFDHKAIQEPIAAVSAKRYEYAFGGAKSEALIGANKEGIGQRTRVAGMRNVPQTRNKRDVWLINTQSYKGAHFAVFPEKLVEPCILAGSSAGTIVLDPFCGSGTVGVVAQHYSRNFIGIELNPDYIQLAHDRIIAGTKKLGPVEQEANGNECTSGAGEGGGGSPNLPTTSEDDWSGINPLGGGNVQD